MESLYSTSDIVQFLFGSAAFLALVASTVAFAYAQDRIGRLRDVRFDRQG